MESRVVDERMEELFPRMTLDAEVQNRVFTDLLFAEVLRAIEIRGQKFRPLQLAENEFHRFLSQGHGF